MSNATDMNIVLGQGSAIKEVHNVGRQNLELNQQFVAQKTEDNKKKVQDFETGNRIEIKGDEEKKNREDSRYDEEGSKKKKSKEVFDSSGGSLIDIEA
jgi:hypothetical protein